MKKQEIREAFTHDVVRVKTKSWMATLDLCLEDDWDSYVQECVEKGVVTKWQARQWKNPYV